MTIELNTEITKFEDNIFARAIREKLQFPTPKNGIVTVMELWDLDLTTLNEMAKCAHTSITKRAPVVDFIGEELPDPPKGVVEFEVMKAVIAYKIEERDAAKLAEEKQKEKAYLEQLLVERKAKEDGKLSVEELEARIAELK